MKRVFSFLLAALLIFGLLPITPMTIHAAEESATLSFSSTTNRTSYSTTQQVWEQNGITFTNDKASSSTNVGNYSNPVRLYAKSSATIACSLGNITKIEVTCSSSSYATVFKNSAGSEATSSGSVVTITPTVSATSYKIASFTAQTRVSSITVYYEPDGSDSACEHTNTAVQNAVAATCTTDGYTGDKVCSDCGETVTAGEVIDALGHSYDNGVCSVCGDTLPTVSFSVPSQVDAVSSITAAEIDLPSANDYTGKYAYTFVGWAESSVSDTTTAPTLHSAGSVFKAENDTTLYAVYTYSEGGTGGSSGYVKKDITEITANDIFVITMTKGETVYALPNNGGASTPDAIVVTLTGGNLAEAESNLLWNLGGSSGAYIFYPNGSTSTWLYCTSSNSGVRVGTDSGYNTFEIKDDYLYNSNRGRYFGVYTNNPDWRSYTSINSNITGQTLGFYVLSGSAEKHYTSTLENADTTCAHTNTTEVTVNATCTIAGSVTVTCADCGATISETVIPATGHKEVTDAAVAATCVNTGLTEGSHCSVCGTVIVAQETTNATGVHNYENGVCTMCNAEEPSTGSVAYELVTDTAEIIAGGQFVIVANGDQALSTDIASKMSGVTVTFDEKDRVVYVDGTTPVWTIEKVSDTSFALSNGTYYLKYSSGTNLGSSTTEYEWTLTSVGDAFRVESETSGRGLVYRASTYNQYGGYALTNVTGSSDEYFGVKFYKMVILCEHENTEEHAAEEATCTAEGYTAGVYCTDCESYIEGHEVVAMKDHSYDDGAVTTAPTCTATGVMTFTCTVCEHSYTESIDATEHSMGDGVVVDPTCTVDGSKTYTCTVCGKEQSEVISANGHTWSQWAETSAPTCTDTGKQSRSCSVCGETETQDVSALGHAWDEGTQTLEPTCDTAGVMTYTCERGCTKTEGIPAPGHSYGADGICTVCGKEVSRFQLVTDYKDILEGGQFVLAIKNGDTYYALGTADAKFGSDMPGCIVQVNGSGAESWVQWTEDVPVWNVEYFINGQSNSFTLSYGGKYLTHTGDTSFGSSTDPFAWSFINKDAYGNNEYDSDYAVIAEDGVVSFYTASSKDLSRSVSLYKTSPDVYFRTYSNNNNFDTVCFFKVVKEAGASCTVNFMENGQQTMTQTVENGEYITLPEPTLDTYPQGYTHFVGWVPLPCMETLIAPDEIYYVSESAGDQNTLLQVTEDMTLYALYSRTDPDAEGQSMSYHQVTDQSQLVVGQYYIIVGYDAANDKWFAMSLDQYADARGGSWVTPDENGVITIVPDDRVASFHLEQGYNTDSYGFFDVVRNQFLSSSAATEDNNSLRSVATLGVSESFQIQINADGSYSIISLEKDSVNFLVLYNTNDNKNPLFSCYDEVTGIDKTKTYLYVGQTNTVPGAYYATGICAHDYQKTAYVEPSCTTAGYTQYTCSICGEIKMENVVAHGHNLGAATVVDATCTEAGSKTSVCQNADCLETYVETIPALGHDYVGKVEDEDGVPTLTYTCSRCSDSYSIKLKFIAANVSLENTLIVGFFTNTDIAAADGFTDIRAEFEYGNRVGENQIPAINLADAALQNGAYRFPCRYITPSQIGDTITATLYGSYNGVEYCYQKTYSVAEYCHNKLNADDSSEELKTLLVNLLYYCDYARAYSNYKANETPVTDGLTEEQKALVLDDREYSSVLNSRYEVIDAPQATWKAARLVLYHSVRMEVSFTLAEGIDISSVTAYVTVDSEERTGTIKVSETDPNLYYIVIDDLKAREMSSTVLLTLYQGDTKISNTASYSIESYVYAKQNDSNVKLANLVKAMIRYGDAANAYFNSEETGV